MTRPACFSQPPGGRVTSAMPRIRSASSDSDGGIMTTCTCERDALSEAVLVRVSIVFTRESEALSKVVLIRASHNRAYCQKGASNVFSGRGHHHLDELPQACKYSMICFTANIVPNLQLTPPDTIRNGPEGGPVSTGVFQRKEPVLRPAARNFPCAGHLGILS